MMKYTQEIDTEHRDDDIRNFYWIYQIKVIAEHTDKYDVEKYLNDMGRDGYECFSITKQPELEKTFIRYHFKKRMDKRYTIYSTDEY